MTELSEVRLPEWVMSEIWSGQVSATGMRILRHGQYSLRKLGLRTLLGAVSDRHHQCEQFRDVDRAWTVLAEAERRDAAVVEDVLMAPTVGVWLRRALRHALDVPTDPSNGGHELTWIHSIAAAAAVRSGMTCVLPAPVMHGAVFLPTVGRHVLPSGTDTEQVELRISQSASSATVAGRSDALTQLEPVRRHRTTANGNTLEAIIDSADPYRRFTAPQSADGFDDGEYDRWTALLDEAWELLTRWHPGYAEEIAAGLVTVVPLPAEDGVVGATSSVAYGSIAMSPKRSAADFAEVLIHEMQHSKLNALFDLVTLSRPGEHPWLYAPWRAEPRPISGLLHGIYAFMSVVEFWDVQRTRVPQDEARRAEFAFGYRANQLNRVLGDVEVHPALTELGREFVAGVSKRLAKYRAADVSPDVARTIDQLTTSHSATWRMCHVRPSARVVERIVQDWAAGRPVVRTHTPSCVVVGEPMRTSSRARLLRTALLEPELFEQLADDGPDRAYATGDHERAAIGYLDRIRTYPDDIAAWVGYGLAVGSGTLRHTPELVQAVHHQLWKDNGKPPDPESLVSWFDRSPASSS